MENNPPSLDDIALASLEAALILSAALADADKVRHARLTLAIAVLTNISAAARQPAEAPKEQEKS